MRFVNQKGDVLYQWAKQFVPERNLGFFNNSPGYHLISKNEKGYVFAFKRVCTVEHLPDHLEMCSGDEVEKLERKTT